jgi:hypothetical protein
MSETIVLRRVKVPLQCQEHRTLGAWARDENGRPCNALASRASRWCAWGALGALASEKPAGAAAP